MKSEREESEQQRAESVVFSILQSVKKCFPLKIVEEKFKIITRGTKFLDWSAKVNEIALIARDFFSSERLSFSNRVLPVATVPLFS